jgi:zinc transport system ATP-binding protein
VTAPVVALRDVWFAYGPTQALEAITLEVPLGAFVGIIGPNGSGKSTLLRVMLGLLTPQRGTVTLFGGPPERLKSRWRVGYVPQRPATFATGVPATVAEVVETGRLSRLGLWGRPGREDWEAVRKALATLGLEAEASTPVAALSSGQQQRTLIARALASEPELLILDEAMAGVDLETQEGLYSLLHRLSAERALTVVSVSHDVGVVASQVTTIACLDRRLLFCGPPTALAGANALQQLYGGAVLLTHAHDWFAGARGASRGHA